MGKFIDITGQRFGRLVVLRFSSIKNKNSHWTCTCDCGKITCVARCHLISGHTKSCGCLSLEKAIITNTTHGYSKTIMYSKWASMIQRCNNQRSNYYQRYGGRGIKVCDRWQNDNGFINFLEDMGERPDKKYSIDRIDNNGDYCKENCRWATKKEQARNRMSNVIIEFHGNKKCLIEWSNILNIPYVTLFYRIKNGWSTQKAFTVPVGKQGHKKGKD